jgi:hypothetical protein
MAVTVKYDNRRLKTIMRAVGQQPKTYIVHDGVEYGVYLEFGTSRMAARPMLRPAFGEVVRQLPRAVGQAINQAIPVDIVLRKAAFDLQARWQRNVVQAKAIDTGAFINSIRVSTE